MAAVLKASEVCGERWLGGQEHDEAMQRTSMQSRQLTANLLPQFPGDLMPSSSPQGGLH